MNNKARNRTPAKAASSLMAGILRRSTAYFLALVALRLAAADLACMARACSDVSSRRDVLPPLAPILARYALMSDWLIYL